MASFWESACSFVSNKLTAIGDGLEDVGRTVLEHRYALGAVGVILGTRLAWRLVKKYKKTRRLTRLRKQKQEERRKAFAKMEQQITRSKMTYDEAEQVVKLTVTELLDRLKSGRLSAVQALTAYQIKALEVHRRTNCLVEPLLEAEEWARELDSKGYQGPLHGLPVSVKDCVGVKGYDTTVGCSQWIGQPCDEDSAVVKVLKQQGAVPFVKTNVPQTMLSWHSTNPIFGLTVNPVDPTRTAGGSSGGEGALIGGGGSLCGIGSDVGGSIRIPGTMCGVAAFKPTSARISKVGGRSLLVGKHISSSWGPMARDVDGLILLMKALLVPEMYHLDPTLPVIPFREEILKDKRPLRIGYSFFNGAFEAVPAMRRGVEEARKLLEASGHELVPWELDLARVAELHLLCLLADGAKEIGEILDCDAVDDAVGAFKRAALLPVVLRRLLAVLVKPFNRELSARLVVLSGYKSVSDYWEAIKELKGAQSSIIKRWGYDEIDAFICPACGCPAVRNHLPAQLRGVLSYVWPFNALDFPAGCVPVTEITEGDEADLANYPSMTDPGQSHRLLKEDLKGVVGLPVSVQVVTLPWRDELCLKVMKELENAMKSR